MTVDELLVKLEKVRPMGVDRWLTRCPAHSDKNPSLAVKVGESGRILVHCWAGCSTDAVVDSLGLEMADLFADRKPNAPGAQRDRFSARDALHGIYDQAILVALIAKRIAEGGEITKDDKDRCFKAAGRIGAAMTEVGL